MYGYDFSKTGSSILHHGIMLLPCGVAGIMVQITYKFIVDHWGGISAVGMFSLIGLMTMSPFIWLIFHKRHEDKK